MPLLQTAFMNNSGYAFRFDENQPAQADTLPNITPLIGDISVRHYYCILLSLAVISASFLCDNLLRAEDWPAWRGPNRDSICREKGLLKEWPENGPPLAWKTTGIGEGFGGPAIVGNMLYITGHRDGKQWVFALDLSKAGKQVWAADFGPVRHNGSGFPGTRATPSIDGDRLYIIGIAGDLACMDIKDGRII
jgi:hypothetical protein